MRLEATLTRDDLQTMATQFAPLRIRLGENGWLSLDAPTDLSLIPNVGLRLVSCAKVHFPLLGVDVPISVQSLTAIVSLAVQTRSDGSALVFHLQLDHADLAFLPKVLDEGLTRLINGELTKKGVELAWKFEQTLSRTFSLPEALETAASLGVRVTAGAVIVTEDALRFAVTFCTDVGRRVGADST